MLCRTLRILISFTNEISNNKRAPVLTKSESLVSLVEELNPVESVQEQANEPIGEERLKVVETIEEEDLTKKQKTKKEREPAKVEPVEEVNAEESLGEVAEDKVKPEKAAAEEVKAEKLEEKKKGEDKEVVKVEPVEEVNAEESLGEVVENAEKPEKIETEEVKAEKLEEKKKGKDKEAVKVEPVEEVNVEESLGEVVEDAIKPEKVATEDVKAEELEEKKTGKDKEAVKVEPVEEVNAEERLEELPTTEKVPEKLAESEVNEDNEVKNASDEVKEAPKEAVDILKTTWVPEISLLEGDSYTFDLHLNGLFKPEAVAIYKDGVKLKPSDFTVKKASDGKSTEVKFNLKKAKDTDSGVYKLCLEDKEIGVSAVKVEKKVAISAPFKADKTEYVEGDNIVLSFALTKPLVDKTECLKLNLGTAKVEYELTENVTEAETTYTITINRCQLKKHAGAYKLRLLANPGDAKSEFYAGQVDIKIKERPVKVLSSDWTPETRAKENQTVVLTLSIDRPLENTSELVLMKDGKAVKVGKEAIVVKNSDDGSVCEVSLTLPTKESGKFKLLLGKGELAQTELKIEELGVIEPLKADKGEYVEGEEVTLRLKLSGPVESVEKCLRWTLNGKAVAVETVEEEEAVYVVRIADVKVKKHGGEYAVKIKQKPGDYACIKISVHFQKNSNKITTN